MNSESFGEYVRRLRKSLNLSLRVVGAEVDIDLSTLSKIERNEKYAPAYIIKPLAKLLNQDYGFLQKKYLSDRIYRELRGEDYALEAMEIAQKRLVLENSGTKTNREKEVLIEKIKDHLTTLPVSKAWLFGSFARDEQKFDSDIDLLVQFTDSPKLDLLDFIGISHDLEDLLGRNVDVVQVNTLDKRIEKIVDQEKVLIYG